MKGFFTTPWEAMEAQSSEAQALTLKQQEIKKRAIALRKVLTEKGVIHSVNSKSAPIMSYVAVDSSYDALIFGPAVQYLVVGAALVDGAEEAGGFFMDTDLPESETLVHVSFEEEYHHRILDGLGSSIELLLAEKYADKTRIVYLDGSMMTFIIRLNTMLSLISRGELNVENSFISRVYELAKRAVIAYGRLMWGTQVIAAPKMSSRQEFSEAYRNLLSENSFPFNDYLILDALLQEGEYVMVPVHTHKYNLAYPDRQVSEDLFQRINSSLVYYLKGVSGKLFKFEASRPFDPSLVFPFTAGKEFFPVFEADQLAKQYLDLLRSEEYPGIEFYRERGGML